jgi:hypothetical protein
VRTETNNGRTGKGKRNEENREGGKQGRKRVGKRKYRRKNQMKERTSKQTKRQVVKKEKEILEDGKQMRTKNRRKEERNELPNAFNMKVGVFVSWQKCIASSSQGYNINVLRS